MGLVNTGQQKNKCIWQKIQTKTSEIVERNKHQAVFWASWLTQCLGERMH